jgi:hypothetical protein
VVPVTAAGVVPLMAGAAVTRLRCRDSAIAADLAYRALAAFVAWGRFGPAPF